MEESGDTSSMFVLLPSHFLHFVVSPVMYLFLFPFCLHWHRNVGRPKCCRKVAKAKARHVLLKSACSRSSQHGVALHCPDAQESSPKWSSIM